MGGHEETRWKVGTTGPEQLMRMQLLLRNTKERMAVL